MFKGCSRLIGRQSDADGFPASARFAFDCPMHTQFSYLGSEPKDDETGSSDSYLIASNFRVAVITRTDGSSLGHQTWAV